MLGTLVSVDYFPHMTRKRSFFVLKLSVSLTLGRFFFRLLLPITNHVVAFCIIYRASVRNTLLKSTELWVCHTDFNMIQNSWQLRQEEQTIWTPVFDLASWLTVSSASSHSTVPTVSRFYIWGEAANRRTHPAVAVTSRHWLAATEQVRASSLLRLNAVGQHWEQPTRILPALPPLHIVRLPSQSSDLKREKE